MLTYMGGVRSMRGAMADIATKGTTIRDDPAPEPLFAVIELMFFAYRDFVRDADLALAGDGFGRAHHRVLYFVTRRPGLTIAELLDILKITKQSLNRVLKDLVDRGYVTSRLGEVDKRQRILAATPRGAALIEEIAQVQSSRFRRAFTELGGDAEASATAFLAAMADAPAPITKAKRGNAAIRVIEG